VDKYYDIDANEVMPVVSFDDKYAYKTVRLDALEVGLKWLYEKRRDVFGAMMLAIADAPPETGRARNAAAKKQQP
jgi:hypothetical protein